MPPLLPTARPRPTSPPGRQHTVWSSFGGMDPDHEVPNPWLRVLWEISELEDSGVVVNPDERHWKSMEMDPVVKGSVEKRIGLSTAKGWALQRGAGPEADLLFDFWSAVCERIPMMDLLRVGFHSVMTGWHPVEVLSHGPERIEGRQVRAPQEIFEAENHHFTWTVGRDLAHRPPGNMSDWRLWRMKSLPAQLRWLCFQQGLSNPYGSGLFGYLIFADYVAKLLSREAVIQLRRGAGIPTLAHSGTGGLLGNSASETASESAARANLKAELEAIIDKLVASGVLIVPKGWQFGIESVDGVFEGWVKVLGMQDDLKREAILGANLLAQSATSGSRALGEVQERISRDQALGDARYVADQVRRKLFLPWTAANAAPLGIPTAGITPRLDDVPFEALPKVIFPGLRQTNLALLKLLIEKVRLDPELNEDFRIDLVELAEGGEIGLLLDGEDGPYPDLARQPSPDFSDGGGEEETPPPSSEEQEPEDEPENDVGR